MPGPPSVEWTSRGFGSPSIAVTSRMTLLRWPVMPVALGGYEPSCENDASAASAPVRWGAAAAAASPAAVMATPSRKSRLVIPSSAIAHPARQTVAESRSPVLRQSHDGRRGSSRAQTAHTAPAGQRQQAQGLLADRRRAVLGARPRPAGAELPERRDLRPGAREVGDDPVQPGVPEPGL